MTDVSTTPTVQSMTTPESWTPLILSGIGLAVLGVLAMVFPFVSGLSLSIIFGALLVVGGVVHLAQAFGTRRWRAFAWQLVLAGVYGLAGFALLANPIVGLATLTTLLIAFFLAEGLVEIIMGVQSRAHSGWGSLVVSGAVSLLLAGLLIAGLPESLLWALGLLFGVNVLVTGLTMAYLGVTNRRRTVSAGRSDDSAVQNPSV